MQNFDRSKISSNESIQLEDGRIRILSEKTHKQIFYYIDSTSQHHKTPIVYMQKDTSHKLVDIDPYLHFDLHFNYIKTSLLADDNVVLYQFMNEYLLKNLKSSKSYKEKERYDSMGNLIEPN